jgi:hypothetical protein
MTSAVLPAHWSEDLKTAWDRSVSQEAKRSRRVRRFVGHVTPSVTVDEAYDECLESLLEASEEASRPNWDGYGAYPVSDATLAQALAFLDLLPSTLPRPEISPHPDGELAFEWSFGPRRLLTVSVTESGRLSYAALFGQGRLHGTEYLLDALPEPVALALRRLYSRE